MVTKEFRVKFNAHGFIPGVDISETDWQMVQSELIAMQNQFANGSNQILEKVNDIWQRYENMKGLNDICAFMMEQAMEIDSETTYLDWVEKWYKDICEAIDMTAMMLGFKVRSNLFRDGDVLMFGVKFAKNPEWTVDVTLEPVKE